MTHVPTRKIDHDRLKAVFIDVCDTLSSLGITYFLEGGTLLGLVRDGRLLPWDPDVDVSIMSEDLGRIDEISESLREKGWRISLRHYPEKGVGFAPGGVVRMMKIKGRSRWYFTPDGTCCDIFVKTRHEGFVYWQAKGCTMRVREHHYHSCEMVEWEGRQLPGPADTHGYLSAKYGDWSVPVKEWSARNELTVVRRPKA